MNKLKNNRGETLIESLCAILIAVMAFAILATTVVTAEKINGRTRNQDVNFRYDTGTGTPAAAELGGSHRSSGTVELHESGGYYYYVPTGGGS